MTSCPGGVDGEDKWSLKLNKVTQLLSGSQCTALPPNPWHVVPPSVCTALSAEALGNSSGARKTVHFLGIGSFVELCSYPFEYAFHFLPDLCLLD